MKNRSNPIPPAGAKALERLREAARSAAASGSGSGTLAGLLLGDLRQAPLLPPDRLEAMLGHVQRNNGQLPPEALTVLPGRDLIISTPSTTPDCYTSPGRSRMRFPNVSLAHPPSDVGSQLSKTYGLKLTKDGLMGLKHLRAVVLLARSAARFR